MPIQSSPAAATCNLTVYYDGSCPLCRSEIGLYRKAQGSDRIDFVDVSTIEGRAVAPDLTQADAMARFHVRKSDGALASGAAGFAQLWLTLPRWKWLGWLVALPGVVTIAEAAYRGFLPIRPWLQRRLRKTP